MSFRIVVKNIVGNLKFLLLHNFMQEIKMARNENRIIRTSLPASSILTECVRIENSEIEPYTQFAHHSDVWNCKIGLRTSVGRYSMLRYADIGRYCAISWNVTIGADSHPIDRISGSGAFYLRRFGLATEDSSKGIFPRTTIGHDVWIGCGVIIKAGVTIGNGVVIGAGSIVTKDIPAYAIVAGNPAKFIRYRFYAETIELLQKSEWWNYNDEFIKENIDAFQQPASPQLLKTLIKKYSNQK